jgi:recombination protein RecT
MTNEKKITAPAAGAQLQTTKPKEPIALFRDLLEKMRAQFEMALPRHLDVDRMLRIFVTTVQRTPKLLECTQASLLGSLMQCAQLGLEPDGILGQAYLVPFENKKAKPPRMECQIIIGYKGLLKLARQSGLVSNISARVVHEKDFFDWEYGLNERLVHKPYKPPALPRDASDDMVREAFDPGPTTHAYAICWLKDGGHHFEVMSYWEIEHIRRNAPSGKSPAWMEHWDEMAKKTALRRTSKGSPASVDDKVAAAIAIDERADIGLPQGDLPELPPVPDHDVLEPKPETDGRRMSLGRRGSEKPAAPAVEVPKPEEPAAERGDEPTAEEMEAAAKAKPAEREPGADDDDVPPWGKR